MPNWETFTLQGARGVVELRVSLNTRGVFTLNQLAFEELGKPEAVEMLFDKQARLIGLKPVSADVDHAYSVRKQGKNKSYLIGARAFCNYYKVDLSNTVRFDEVVIEDGVMILDVNKTSEIVYKPRKTDNPNKPTLFGNANS